MKVQSIIVRYVSMFLILCLIMFLAGVGETVRLTSFDMVESGILNESSVNNTNIWNDYEAFKNTYIYTNAPLVAFVNFASFVGLLYMIVFSWRLGLNSPPARLNEIFTQFTVLLVFFFYILGAVFQYITDVFVNQLIKVLFIEIYSQATVFKFLGEWFFAIVMFSLFLCWFSNQLKYFNIAR